jgi:sec-independent protein translocase protein TatC
MTFWEHVGELRKRLIIASCFVIAGTVAGYILFPDFVQIMQSSLGEQLYAFQIAEGFLVRFEIAFAIGLFLSLPILIFEIVLFILPALKPREKKILLGFLLSSYALFLCGIAFAFQSVLPYSVQFFKSAEFFPENVGRLISFKEYLDFFLVFLLAFGVCFQFPIVMLVILKLKILPLKFFTKNFKYFVIVIFIVAAIITPPDVVSQIMVALPMLALYSLSLLIARITRLGREEKRKD